MNEKTKDMLFLALEILANVIVALAIFFGGLAAKIMLDPA